MSHSPDFETFARLARAGDLVPVFRTLLSDTLTPVSAYAREKIGRYSFLGTGAFLRLEAYGREIVLTEGDRVERRTVADPLAELGRLLEEHRAVHVPGLPRFCGGAVGYAGYDVVRYTEELPNPPEDDRRVPDLSFALYDRMVIFDQLQKTVQVVAHASGADFQSARAEKHGDSTGGSPLTLTLSPKRGEGTSEAMPNEATETELRAAYDRACRRVDELCEQLQRPDSLTLCDIRVDRADPPFDFESNFTRPAFEAAVETCKEYIRAGDIFQVVLSQRLKRETNATPLDIYRALRVVNPSPFMFLLRTPTVDLVGSSPEIMVRVEDGETTIRPLAGTRRRGQTDEEDRRLAEELLADPKERAEHVMLIDLARNDLGRVAQYGTVRLSDVMVVERYSHVMHITSNVSGKLRPGTTALDALRAGLPAGTVSGAPKVRAMEIIDELEPHRRGPYAGAVGYIDFTGNMDTCIALRTLVMQGQTAYIQAGAGIVADSVPASEYEETLNKAKGLLKAMQIAEEQVAGD
ncbi:MAG: chorismate-binding protein [Planctomycetaceae bacterium]